MASNAELHKKLFDAYKKCYPAHSGQRVQEESNKFWKAVKAEHGKDVKSFQNLILDKIKNLNEEAARKKANLMKFFVKATSSKTPDVNLETHTKRASSSQTSGSNLKTSSEASTMDKPLAQTPLKTVDITTPQQSSSLIGGMKRKVKRKLTYSDESDDDSQNSSKSKSNHGTPAQSNTEKRVAFLESQLNAELIARDSGLGDKDIDKKIKKTKLDLDAEKKKLSSQKRNAEYQSKYRKKRKILLTKISEQYPDVTKKAGLAESPGRPRLERDQPELIKAITNIAMFGSQADERRRSQMIRTCRTLDDLHQALLKEGFEISRSATYLRLLPRNSRTNEGKKHVKTAPVKLLRATTELHKTHPDQHFCTANIRFLESLASVLGPNQVFFLSQDDKARVPIGMTAAQKQSPAIMHMEYRVLLPDHDWVIAERHKLIPSVYAAMRIEKGGMGKPDAVSYSGPTYIAIRSGKHSSSTAKTHNTDFNRLLQLPEFTDMASKPVVIFSVDGGPDENPRYPKVIASAIKHFKDHNLDAVFIATNAPGRSAFNRVERRMAPLSLPLSGLVLPHDTFGNHLDASGKTIDADLELKNFAEAGKILAEIWSSIVIDSESVVAEYLPPDDKIIEEITNPIVDDPVWYSTHVQESQYFLQIVKCTDKECCGQLNSDIRKILPEGFFPPPCPLRCESLLMFPAPEAVQESDRFASLFLRLSLKINIDTPYNKVPYDFYCPSVQDALEGRICSVCSKYFASKKAVQLHKKNHGIASKTEKEHAVAAYLLRGDEAMCHMKRNNVDIVEWVDVDDVILPNDEVDPTQSTDRDVPVADPLADWLLSPWTDSYLD